jgi:riboflavin kinase / FMN adenylyltransferase
MQIHRNTDNLPSFKNAVITIGTFDGVHTGHQKIIAQINKQAKEVNGESVIITFHPHPRKVVAGNQPNIQLLTTLDEKLHLLEEIGIDHAVIVPFDEHFASQTAEEYINDFLFEKFHPHTVVIGYDHKFGQGRKGDYHLLEEYGKKLDFQVQEIPEHILHEITISSTRIRKALLHNDMQTVNEFLGHDYFFEGIVVKGNQLGRTLGYPTANLEIESNEKLIPSNGVYAVTVLLENEKDKRKGMMSIGIRPTVGGTPRTIEVNIFDFNADIYGQKLKVFVREYMREEKKYNGLEALTAAIAEDEVNARKILK